MSSRKKSALLSSLLRGASPQHTHALVAIFLLVGSASLLQGCKEKHHVGPCLSIEVVPPEQTSEPGAGRSPNMTAPENAPRDMGEDLRVGPCLKIAVEEPEDMGADGGGEEVIPVPEVGPCLSVLPDEPPRQDLDKLERPDKQGALPRERTRMEVLERLSGSLPVDVLARLRRELGDQS